MTDQQDNFFGGTPVPQEASGEDGFFGGTPVAQPTQNPEINQAIENHFNASIGAAAKANVDAEGNQQPFSLEDAWKAGWQNSELGLQLRHKLPDTYMPEQASFMQKMVGDTAELIGNTPAAVAGFGIGAAGGSESGPGAVITGAGGAFALPTAMRQILIDGYKKGDFQSPQDFIARASGIMLKTAKSWLTGAGTATAGLAAAPLGTTATLGSQAVTMTELSKRLNGQVPKWSDFVENGALMFGLHSVGLGTDKLADIYKKTGVQPQQVAEDAQNDPVLKTEILSNQEIPTKYLPMVQQPKEVTTPGENGATGPQTPGEGFTDEEKAAYAKVGEQIVDEQGTKVSPKATFNSFYKDIVDNLDPIKRAQEKLANGTDLKPSEDPYMLMRLLRGGYERANQFVSHNTIDFNTYRPNGDSLAAVLAPIKEGEGTIDGLNQTMVALRSLELEQRGIKTGVDQNAATTIGNSDEAYRVYGKMAENIVAYQNRVAQYAKEAGFLSDSGFEAMKKVNKYFIPFNRLFEDPEEMAGQSSGGSPFKTIEGSDRKIINPLATVIKNTYQITALADRNAAKLAMIKLARQSGHVGEGKLFEPVNPMSENQAAPKFDGVTKLLSSHALALTDDEVFQRIETAFKSYKQPVSPNHISVYEDGIRKLYNVGDPDLAVALQGSPPVAHGLFFKMHAEVTKWGRAGAILDPAFLPKHMVRQNINAGVYSENNLIPFVSMARGVLTHLTGDKDGALWQGWRSSGGMNSEFTAMDRRYIANKVNEIEGKGVLQQSLEQAQNNPLFLGKLPYNALLKAMDFEHAGIAFHDNSIRIEEYRKSYDRYIKAGMSEKDAMLKAGYDSREVLTDYMRTGAKMVALNQLSMFARMRVLGADKMATALKNNPTRTLAKLSLLIAVPTVLNWAANHKDPRYQDQPDWQKDTNWVIPTDDWRAPRAGDIIPVDLTGKDVPWLTRTVNGQKQYNFGAILRVPKPPEDGQLFGSGLEHLLDYASGERKETWTQLAANILDNMAPQVVPTLEKPMLEQFANKSFFTNGPIVPGSAENRLPAQQYTPYTTELAKAMGRLIGTIPGVDSQGQGNTLSVASPAVVENYVRDWGSSLGMTLLHLSDQGLRDAGVLPNPTQPTPTLADNMFVKGFVVRYPTATTQSIEDFNKQFKVAFKTYTSMQFLAKNGNMAMAMKLAQTEPFMQQIMSYKKAMDNAQRYISQVTSNPKMNPNDKRQLIDSGYYQLITMAKQANTQLKLMAAEANRSPVEGLPAAANGH